MALTLRNRNQIPALVTDSIIALMLLMGSEISPAPLEHLLELFEPNAGEILVGPLHVLLVSLAELHLQPSKP